MAARRRRRRRRRGAREKGRLVVPRPVRSSAPLSPPPTSRPPLPHSYVCVASHASTGTSPPGLGRRARARLNAFGVPTRRCSLEREANRQTVAPPPSAGSWFSDTRARGKCRCSGKLHRRIAVRTRGGGRWAGRAGQRAFGVARAARSRDRTRSGGWLLHRQPGFQHQKPTPAALVSGRRPGRRWDAPPAASDGPAGAVRTPLAGPDGHGHGRVDFSCFHAASHAGRPAWGTCVGEGPSGPDWPAIAFGYWSGRALATGTAWAVNRAVRLKTQPHHPAASSQNPQPAASPGGLLPVLFTCFRSPLFGPICLFSLSFRFGC